MGTEITKNDLPTEVKDYIDALEERVEELDGDVGKSDEALAEVIRENDVLKGEALGDKLAKSDSDEAFTEAISKADPATRAILESQRTQLQTAEAAIAKSAADATEATMVAKSAELTHVHVEKADDDDEGMVGILKTAYGVSAEYGDQLFEVLKRTSDLVEQGDLFSELGAGGGSTVIAKSAEAQAAALRKEDPELSEEEALAKIYTDDPALYEQAKQEG